MISKIITVDPAVGRRGKASDCPLWRALRPLIKKDFQLAISSMIFFKKWGGTTWYTCGMSQRLWRWVVRYDAGLPSVATRFRVTLPERYWL